MINFKHVDQVLLPRVRQAKMIFMCLSCLRLMAEEQSTDDKPVVLSHFFKRIGSFFFMGWIWIDEHKVHCFELIDPQKTLCWSRRRNSSQPFDYIKQMDQLARRQKNTILPLGSINSHPSHGEMYISEIGHQAKFHRIKHN